MRSILIALALMFFSAVAVAQPAPTIETGNANATPGQVISIPVAISAGNTVVAAQFDLSFDASTLLPTGVSAGSALNGHQLDFEEVAPGVMRVVITTGSQVALGNGPMANIGLQVASEATAGEYPLILGNVVLADSLGEEVNPVSVEDGLVTVESTTPVNIPTLGLPGYVLLTILLMGLAWVFLRRGVNGVVLSCAIATVLFSTAIRAVTLPGDANDDGEINAADIPVITAQILGRETAPGEPDCNEDSRVDVLDTVCVSLADTPNSRPTIQPIGDRITTLGEAFQITVSANDPDLPDDVLTFTLDTAPAGMGVAAASGLISWTPDGDQLGPHDVSVRVTDLEGLFTTTSFTVTVVAVKTNSSPNLLEPGNRILEANATFTTNLFATDPDVGDTLSFSLPISPAGMSVDPSSGLLSWQPGAGDLGDHPVTARVTDSGGLTDDESFTVEVLQQRIDPPTNRSPLLTVPVNAEIVFGNLITLSASATDPDDGDTLTFSLTGSPSGMSINSTSGAISWTPVEAQVGAHDVTVKVTDTAGAVALGSFVVIVLDINRAPLAVDDVYEARLGVPLNVAASGVLGNDSDPNGDALSAVLDGDVDMGDLTLNADGSFEYLLEPPDRSSPVELELECEITVAGDRSRYQSSSTLAVGDIDNDGDIEIVGVGGIDGSTALVELWILNASDCSEQSHINKEAVGAFSQASHPGLLDIDGDGDLEIITVRHGNPPPVGGFDGKHLIAVHHDGSLAWPGDGGSETSTVLDELLGTLTYWSSGPAFADLDADGTSEIIMGFAWGGNFSVFAGAVVYDATDGSVLWDYLSDFRAGGGNRARIPTVVDLDLDGTMEIIIHNDVLSHTGVPELRLPTAESVGTGTAGKVVTAVANFDEDAYPEILAIDERNHYLFNHDGTVVWEIERRNFSNSQVTVADFDGDGAPEYALVNCEPPPGGFACSTYYIETFDGDGSRLWSHQGDSGLELNILFSDSENITAFDANRDGSLDLVFQNIDSNVDRILIIDGRNGSVLESIEVGSYWASGVRNAFLTIADVDGDGEAEIVTSYTSGLAGDTQVWGGTAANPLPSAPSYRNQWAFQQGYSTDARTMTQVPLPHWLQPGLNGWNLIKPEPDPLVGTNVSFTYVANDGDLNSNEATVTLDILPAGNPPLFLTQPDTLTTRGFPYAYAPIVVDPDLGDSVTFSLTVGPTGMSIDAATGEINWNPQSNGSFDVSILALDTIGFASAQTWVLEVGEPVVVPDVAGQPEATAESTLSSENLVTGSIRRTTHPSIPSGSVFEQTPPAGSVTEFGGAVDLNISLGPAPEDIDNDGDGFTENEGDCNDANSTIYPGANDPIGDGTDQDCDGLDGSLPISEVVIQPAAVTLLEGETVALQAFALFNDNSAQPITSIASWGTSNGGIATAAGNGRVTAFGNGTADITATRGAVAGQATVTVVGRDPGDDEPPLAVISSPAEGEVITGMVDVIGTASDSGLVRYRLELAPAGSIQFTVLAEGTSPVSNDVLGQLDTTLLVNGIYTLRLSVLDAGGNQSLSEANVLLDGFLKAGLFTISFTDSSLPASGLPLELVRTYDSRDRRKGDFGIGWSLGLKSASLSCVDPLGEDWTVVKAGLSWSLLPNRAHACVVQIPGERAEVFDFVPNPSVSPIVPFSLLSGSFVPRSGTRGELVNPDGINLAIVTAQPGPAQLLTDDDFSVFAPDQLHYTRPDGLVLEFAGGELESIIDPSGNSLTFSDFGLTHSNGRGFTFSRDGAGRITSITDPMGNTQSYQYSSSGDLVSHTDSLGNVTRYFYNQLHGLLRIEDPLNRPVLRNDYDDEGRLISTLEPDGRLITFDYSSGGREQTITDSDGSVSVVNSDADGNVTSILDALGGQVLQSFDAQGNLLSRTDENGNTTTYTYDAKGNKLTETDALGRTQTFTYDAFGNVTSDNDQLGRTTTFAYNSNGLASSRTNALGVVDASLTWDSKGNLLSRTDAQGNTETYSYNSFGDPTSVTDARGNQATYSYDANGALLSSTDKFGQTTTFTHNANGDLLSETDPLGRTTQFEYDAAGQLIRVTDASGAVQEKQYDGEGNVTVITDPLGQSGQLQYSLQGNLIRRVSPGGLETVYEYDSLDRQTRIKSPGGQDVTVEYDDAGNVSSQEDALGNTFQISWDAGDRPDAMTGPDGTTVQRVYDAAGNLLQQTDALGRSTGFEYDALNRLTRTIFPDGTDEMLAYDSANNVVQKTDPGGNVTGYEYDANNNLVKVTEPLGGETLFEYDANDRMVAIEDAGGNRTVMEYDTAGQLTRKVYPEGTAEETGYDAAGRVTSTTDPDGDVTQFSYDAKGRLTGKTYADGSNETFAWNANDQLVEAINADGTVTYQYNADGLLATLVNADGSSIDYGYDARGQVTSITTRTLPSPPARTTLLSYEEFGRLVRVEDPDGAETDYSFDAMSNLLSTSFANGTQSQYEYDSLNRLVQVAHSNADGEFARFGYTLDALGNRTRVGMLDGSYIEYQYDAQRRLIRESHFSSAAVRQFELNYEYDAVGNRTRTVNLAGQETLYSYNEADQLLSAGLTSFAWEPDGNLASRTDPSGSTWYEFDARNRLVEVQKALDLVNFGYDARGELVRRSLNGAENNFLVGIAPPGQPSQVLVEYDSAGNPIAENVFGNRQISRQHGGTTSYMHIDASLNVRHLTDAVGGVSDTYVYDAFGNILGQNGTTDNPYRFAGERLGQAEGLSYNRARYYSPESGQFISRDPFAGLPEVPATLHRYMYGFQNPLTYSDPNGELSFASVVTAVTIVGLVVGIGVNYLTDVKSSAKERKGLTDQFRAKFCRGGLLGEGAAIADQTVLIAENEKDLRPGGPTSANYSVFAFGWGWGVGTIGSNNGDEETFLAVGTRNVTQFEGTGKLSSGGYSVSVGGYGAGGVGGEAHFLPEGSEIPLISKGKAGSALGTAGFSAVSLTTFWNLEGKNNAIGWNGALDCYRKPFK